MHTFDIVVASLFAGALSAQLITVWKILRQRPIDRKKLLLSSTGSTACLLMLADTWTSSHVVHSSNLSTLFITELLLLTISSAQVSRQERA